MKKVVIAALVGAIALAGCSKKAEEAVDDVTLTCEPGEGPLTVSAKDSEFDTKCLAVAADGAFTVDFTNNDSFPHNFSIYKESGGEDLFKGKNQDKSGTVTYNVDALPAGDYYFQCDIHDDMNGKFRSVAATP
ncbi:MAG: cupredoxin domain-containing protein [Actinomycetota bacterium]